QPAAALLLDPVHVVELGARRVSVTGAAAGARAVRAGPAAEGDQAVGVRRLRDGTAGVGDRDVLALQGGRAGGAAEDARGVGVDAARHVGPRQRHHHLGGGAVLLGGATGRLAVLVLVVELDHLPGGGVDAAEPGAHLARALEGELPGEQQAAAATGGVALG